jgi:hypothetical protein
VNRAVFMQAKGHQHAEAFCLMKYSSDDSMIVEWLWNSRDGVTPFIIRSRDGTTELVHREMHLDRYMPDYEPLGGERIFVDMTEARARMFAEQRLETFWDAGDTIAPYYQDEPRQIPTPVTQVLAREQADAADLDPQYARSASSVGQ